jgi:hypothetical protein
MKKLFRKRPQVFLSFGYIITNGSNEKNYVGEDAQTQFPLEFRRFFLFSQQFKVRVPAGTRDGGDNRSYVFSLRD